MNSKPELDLQQVIAECAAGRISEEECLAIMREVWERAYWEPWYIHVLRGLFPSLWPERW